MTDPPTIQETIDNILNNGFGEEAALDKIDADITAHEAKVKEVQKKVVLLRKMKAERIRRERDLASGKSFRDRNKQGE